MDKLIESMSNINVRKNDGYLFIKRDEIYVPIMKTILLITKRSFYSLPLLDEIVLRLINEGIQEIDELVNILGIDRKLLEVTLADLSVKDVIYCTTNRCSLLAKGKQALRELRTVQRKKDTVKNVYLDPINRKIILEHENYQFVDRVNVNDKKLDADFEVNDIEIFKENIDSVNKVFLDEMNIYNDKTKSEPDELLSIDSIENVYVKFVRIPIYIYVSSEGIDIDIMAVNKRNDPLLVLFKSEIIEQIRKKKVLKNIFVKYGLRKTFLGVDLEENENLKLAVLSGPSFACEVMDGKNTAVVIASDKTNIARQLQIIFNNAHFRVYTTDDIIGVEYCGAIKNVFAIICGMIDGANMGANTKNAIITRGLNEIRRVISFVGGNPKTLYGLAGIGDIMLTCNSLESRNYSYGFHYTKDASLSYNQNGTIEGLNTINEIYKIAKVNNLEMPIIESLYNILFNNSTIDVESLKLMKRDMKDE